MKESCFWHGTSYTEEQASEAKEIRKITSITEKDFLIKCFEVETGKKFPHSKTIRLGYNTCTAHISSLEIERGATFIDTHRHEACKHLAF